MLVSGNFDWNPDVPGTRQEGIWGFPRPGQEKEQESGFLQELLSNVKLSLEAERQMEWYYEHSGSHPIEQTSNAVVEEFKEESVEEQSSQTPESETPESELESVSLNKTESGTRDSEKKGKWAAGAMELTDTEAVDDPEEEILSKHIEETNDSDGSEAKTIPSVASDTQRLWMALPSPSRK